MQSLFVVELAFAANPERLAARPAHRQRLQQLHAEGVVFAAGPFDGDTGAMLIFIVHDLAALDTLLTADPYFRTPGVTVVSKRRWSPVVP